MKTKDVLMLAALGWIIYHLSDASPAVAAEQQAQWSTLNAGCLSGVPMAQPSMSPAWVRQMRMAHPPSIIFEGTH